MDYNKISKNSGARQVAKMKANSQWGYLAMHTNKTKHKFVDKPSKLYQMLADDRLIIHNIIPVKNKNLVQVYYSTKEEDHFGGLNTNVAVAAFVTCYGRLRLFNEIDKLKTRCLYFDTDSIIFISRPNEYEPVLGNYLGQFTNEIDPKDGNYIVEFVSAGPKNYAYLLDTGISKCTVKGITQNNVVNLTINYESIKNIVCNDRSGKLMVKQLSFIRDNKKWNVSTQDIDKTYGFVYDKRVLKQSDLSTKPYGFKFFVFDYFLLFHSK